MASTDNVTVRRLTYYHTKDKAQRAGEISSAVATETSARQAADTNLQSNIDAINEKIPSAATSTNKLTDEDLVNDKVSTLSGKLLDAVNTKADLPTTGLNKNDTCCVLADETHSNQCWLYQYSGTAWAAKYKISDTPLTSAQIAALNSGVTSAKVSGYDTHLTSTSNPHSVTAKQTLANISSHAGEYIKVNAAGTDVEYGTPAGAVYTAGQGITIDSSNSISANECTEAEIDAIFT